MSDTATDQAIVTNRGPLSSDRWQGNISALDETGAPKVTPEQQQDIVTHINEYFVPTSSHAPTRCIDGRRDPELHESHLGPQVPGGTICAPLALRLSLGKHTVAESTFLSDVEALIEACLRLGMTPGDHRDDHAEGTKVGCGALDNIERAVGAMTDPSLAQELKGISESLLGGTFSDAMYAQVLDAAQTIKDNADAYLVNSNQAIDLLEGRVEHSTSTLTGSHNECFVIINSVSGTTFSSNKFAEDHNGVQAFCYDVWRTLEVAEKLFPGDGQQNDRQKYIIARVASAIATLMVLTDGSQTLITRTPV